MTQDQLAAQGIGLFVGCADGKINSKPKSRAECQTGERLGAAPQSPCGAAGGFSFRVFKGLGELIQLLFRYPKYQPGFAPTRDGVFHLEQDFFGSFRRNLEIGDDR